MPKPNLSVTHTHQINLRGKWKDILKDTYTLSISEDRLKAILSYSNSTDYGISATESIKRLCNWTKEFDLTEKDGVVALRISLWKHFHIPCETLNVGNICTLLDECPNPLELVHR
jgi:hypothetical protein